MQTALWPDFDERARALVNDRTGEIRYFPRSCDRAQSAEIFHALIAGITWRADERRMYDRVVAVPRLVAGRRDAGALAATVLDRLQRDVEALTGERYNSIGINRYRNERDSVAWHNDTLGELVALPAIALVSLGAVRRMQIRSKAVPRRSFEIDLDAGSVLLMRGASQQCWEHRIPKETRAIGERISVAFRQRPVADPV